MINDFFGLLVTWVEIITFISLLGLFAERKQWYQKYKLIYIPLTVIGSYIVSGPFEEYMYVKFAVMIVVYALIVNVAVKIKVYALAALSVMYFTFITLIEFLVGMLIIKIGLFH